MPRTYPLLLTVLGLFTAASAQNKGVGGEWRTPGGSLVRIAPCGSDVCATLLQVEGSTGGDLDLKNPDVTKRAQKLCGLQIGYGFHLTDAAHAEDGRLYDPKSGRTYRGMMSADGDQLDLRGYVGIRAFGRTERWVRTNEAPRPCS